MRRTLLPLLLLVAACGTQANGQSNDDPPPNPKFFVCKYETDPKGEERLQTGQNPISVSENAFPAGVTPAVGVEFNDAQGRSIIIAEDVGQPEPPTRDDCPPPNPPPTTTTTSTTSTTTTSSTTTTTTTLPPSTTTCPDCVPNTQLVTTTTGPTTTAATTTTMPASTTTVPGGSTTTTTGVTTTLPGATTTTLPPTFSFAGATTVCVVEVPTIRITFGNTFPALAGQTGTLTMAAVNGTVVSTQALVYAPGTTVDLLYPGTRVNVDGTIADVPGWNLTNAGLWVRDPSDEFLREGIRLTYTVNPTATAFVTYPPESSACANPDGPFPPGVTPPPTVTAPPTTPTVTTQPPVTIGPPLPPTK